jgi:hypothetical protein
MHPCPSPKEPRVAAKGRARAAATAWGGARPAGPQNPNPGLLEPGPKVSPLFSLMGFFFEKGPLVVFPIFNYLININSFN